MATSQSSVRAGQAYVELSLRDVGFRAGAEQALTRMRAFGKSIRGVGDTLLGIGDATELPMIEIGKEFAAMGGKFDDIADRTGLSAKAVSELAWASQQAGTDLDTVEKAIWKMQKAIGNGDKSLEGLNLNMAKLSDAEPDIQFLMLAEAIGKIKDPTTQTAKALEIFGKTGAVLLPLFKDNAAQLKFLRGEAERLGFTWSDEDISKAAKLDDSVQMLETSFKRLKYVVGSAIAPALDRVLNLKITIAKNIGDVLKSNSALVSGVFSVVGVLGPIGAVLIAAGLGMQVLSYAGAGLGLVFTLLGAVFGLVFSKAFLITAAVVGIAYAFLTLTEKGRTLVRDMSTFFGSILETAKLTWAGVQDSISAQDYAGAIRVAGLGMRVEWLRIKTATLDIWRQIVFGLRAVWSDFTSWMVTRFAAAVVSAVNGLADILDELGIGGDDLRTKAIDLGDVDKERRRERDLLVKGNAEEQRQRQAEVDAANADLKQAVDAAALKKQQFEAAKKPNFPDEPPPDTTKKDIAGTFSASMASLLGASSPNKNRDDAVLNIDKNIAKLVGDGAMGGAMKKVGEWAADQLRQGADGGVKPTVEEINNTLTELLRTVSKTRLMFGG